MTKILKQLVLDRDRPFQRNPENVRKLLLLLLQMEPEARETSSEKLSKMRFERMMKAVISSPVMEDMPSLHAQATQVLHSSTRRPGHRVMAVANQEIVSFVSESESEKSIAEEYVLARLSMQHSKRGRERRLGYKFSRSLEGEEEMAVHQQRVEDILGTAMTKVLRVVESRGFLCPELTVRRFFDLVDDYKRFEGSSDRRDYEAFVFGVVAAERDVEAQLESHVEVVGEMERRGEISPGMVMRRLACKQILRKMRESRADEGNVFGDE